jgi:polyphenol oxidase
MPTETIIGRAAADNAAADVTLADSGFYWRVRDGLMMLVCRPLEDIGFANGFSTRLGGVSSLVDGGPGIELSLAGFNEDSRQNIYENRRRFLSLFPDGYQLALAYQIHSDKVRIVVSASDGGDSDERADAVISDLDDVLAGVKTADCVPILVGDPVKKAYAAVHAGWRGTVQSIVKKAVLALTSRYGSSPSDLIAAIGPAAGCNMYEVGEEVIAAFAENFDHSERYFRETAAGHALVDLKAANRDQLVASGVLAQNIYISPFCTMTDIHLFFSYRIEKKMLGRTGRLMSVVGRL